MSVETKQRRLRHLVHAVQSGNMAALERIAHECTEQQLAVIRRHMAGALLIVDRVYQMKGQAE